ncbi:MAG: carbon storage regulator CsrA [Myxococcota bacterium]
MLVLTRKLGETIRIGDEVTVRVLEVHRGQVRLAIDAPRDVSVHREEIWELVRSENQRAAAAAHKLDPVRLWRSSREKRRGRT